MIRFSIVALLAFSSVGCAGSFEEARAPKRLASAPPPSERCVSLDDAEATWNATAIGAGALAGGSGIATIPVESKEGEIALAATAAGLAGISAFSSAMSSSKAESWARECSNP